MTGKKSQLPDCGETTSLREIQSAMLTQVIRPLNFDASKDEPSACRDQIFTSTAVEIMKPGKRIDAVQRLELYSRQYWYRLLDSMVEDFPAVQAILGQEKFDALITAYLVRYPSTSYELRDLGQKLPAFIRERPDLSGKLAEVAFQAATVEYAAIEAFDLPIYEKVNASVLSNTPPDELKLSLQPYIKLLRLDYALDDFVLRIQKKSALHSVSTAQTSRTKKASSAHKLPRKEQVYLAIHRLNNDVYYKRLDQDEYQILTSLQNGLTLGEACAELAGRLKDSQLANLGNWLKRTFAEWIELGWLTNPEAENQCCGTRDA